MELQSDDISAIALLQEDVSLRILFSSSVINQLKEPVKSKFSLGLINQLENSIKDTREKYFDNEFSTILH